MSLRDRALMVLRENDTLLNAAIAIPKGRRLTFADRSWLFVAPPGVRRVGRKHVEPLWVPPEWHYAELAAEHNLRLRKLERGNPIGLSDGTRLEVRGMRVGQVGLDGRFIPFSPHHEIVRDSTVFIPPPGTVNRMIEGELGSFSLDLGDGYLIHGTPQPESVGAAVTHGCFRLGDEDMEWLYRHVPVGTRVYIF